MKRLFKISFMSVLLMFVFFTSSLSSLKADTPAETLIVNYHRFDGNYSGWSLWLWQSRPVNGDGQNINFTGYNDDTGSRQLVYDLEGTHLEGATEVGVIVRTSSWEKDVPVDLLVDMSEPDSNGVVEVFLVSKDPTVYYDAESLDLTHRLLSVEFTSMNSIQIQSSLASLTKDDVTVYADDEPIEVDALSMMGFTGEIDLAEDIDLAKSYRLEVDFSDGPAKSYDIGLRGVYSSEAFNQEFAYDGELGAIYSNDSTTFKIWAPISTELSLNLYETGHHADDTDYDGVVGTDEAYETHEMTYQGQGVWEVTVDGDLHGVYYTFDVTNGSITHRDVVDPYTRSTGINGERGMVVDFERLNPDGWTYGTRPNNISHYSESIISEVHIRDYTTHETWNGTEAWRGKFLGFVETGTRYEGVKTGFDHFVDLGVTHVQLLPVHDIGMAIDERRIDDPNYSGRKDTIFNWGYMTLHFNTLEGSYATDPYNGEVRIEEFKELVKTFHEHDMRVIMDVVYNHTATSGDSNFEKLVPGYYFRFEDNGTFSNGSGTGNETASENYMFRKFMVDSLKFWAEEYNISGFRFDLMKLHDVTTMQAIQEELHAIDETILIFGEPWDAGGSNLDESEAAYNANLDRLPGVSVFNDDTRDGVKGSVFNSEEPGFIQGETSSGIMNRIMLGIVGGVYHNHISQAALPKGAWAQEPYQSVNYVTAHDNNTLHDKLMLSVDENTTYEEVVAMQKQANAIILTSQGISFLHGGVELMRTKPCIVIGGEDQGECTGGYDHNSYRSPDAANQIDWNWKVDNIDVFNYYKGLIALRRNINVFSYETAEEVQSNIDFLITPNQPGLISYLITDEASPWNYTLVAHNNGSSTRYLDLLGLEWNMVVNKDQAGLETIETVSGTLELSPNESVVLYVLADGATWPVIEETPASDGLNMVQMILIGVGSAAFIAAGATTFVIFKKRG
ncbi:MAG: type I pullulanase [Candidatus Izemoplasmataceae bacterium]